ncbi:MAG TPA: 50S ribosomal protein L25 [Planctomycetota bacterium]|nr:50S ribosomal protein L25 [Planctomycetota bacterium]
MAEQFAISAEKREALGTRVSRRLRKSGKIPAVLARKGEDPLHLLVDAKEFAQLVKKHARIINLTHPAGKDKVFIKEVQYDHLDEHAIHVDFTRIAMDQLLTIEVPLILKGKPVGVSEEGGVLDQYIKTLKIQCLPDAIPDHIEADVTSLKKDVKFTIKDLALPAGLKAAHDPDLLLAIVQEHKVEEIAPAAAAAGPVEPELIKKPKETEEGAEGEAKGEKKEAAPKKEEKK